jgi:hypothetical protein
MVRKTLVPVALLLAFATLHAAPVPEKALVPDGPAPVLVSAEIGKDGALTVGRRLTRSEVVPEKVEIVVGGQKQAVTRYITREVFVEVMERYDLKEVKAFGTDGKPIDAVKLAELFKKSTPVVVSADGNKVGPYYLQLFKEGTVILVLPAAKEPPEKVLPPEKK